MSCTTEEAVHCCHLCTILCFSKPASYQQLATGLLAQICEDKSGNCHAPWGIGKQSAVKHMGSVWLHIKQVTL